VATTAGTLPMVLPRAHFAPVDHRSCVVIKGAVEGMKFVVVLLGGKQITDASAPHLCLPCVRTYLMSFEFLSHFCVL
jgi:hypothetical protein